MSRRLFDSQNSKSAYIGCMVGAPLIDFKSSDAIMKEEQETDAFIKTVGKAIYSTFTQPFADAFDRASAMFAHANGRAPASNTDLEIVRGMMVPAPSQVDFDNHTYHAVWVTAFQTFRDAWDAFYNSHQGTMFKSYSTFSDTVEWKKKAEKWRQELLDLVKGSPQAIDPRELPAPVIPDVAKGIPDITQKVLPDTGTLKAIAAIVIGIVLIPPIVNIASNLSKK